MNVPKGFSLIDGRGTYDVLVPTYLVPATKLAMETEEEKERLYVDGGEPGVSDIILAIEYWDKIWQPRPAEELGYYGIAEGLVKVPADPVRIRL